MTNLLPDKIYHYTTDLGLYGILDSQCLWATHFQFLNDSSEVTHILKDIIDPFLFTKAQDKQKEVFGRIGNTYIKMFGLDGGTREFDVYIISFCKNPDLLSQWRGYSANGGYAIGFDTSKLVKICKIESEKFLIGPCSPTQVIYSDEEKIRIMEEIAGILVNNDSEESKIGAALVKNAPIFKHSGFIGEEEFRIFTLSRVNYGADGLKDTNDRKDKVVHFKEKSRIPYIELFKDNDLRLPITEIIVGPPNNELGLQRKKTLELYLAQNNINAEVKISALPYVERAK